MTCRITYLLQTSYNLQKVSVLITYAESASGHNKNRIYIMILDASLFKILYSQRWYKLKTATEIYNSIKNWVTGLGVKIFRDGYNAFSSFFIYCHSYYHALTFLGKPVSFHILLSVRKKESNKGVRYIWWSELSNQTLKCPRNKTNSLWQIVLRL